MTNDNEEKKDGVAPDGGSPQPAVPEVVYEKVPKDPFESEPDNPVVPEVPQGVSPEAVSKEATLHPKKHRKGEAEQIRALKDKVASREREIEALRKDIDELKDRYLRSAAEMENTRKRLEREKADYFQFAQSDLIKDLLGVLDNLERACKTGGESPENKCFQEGLDLILKQFLDLLRKRGVTPIEPTSNKFDPTIHQAILTEEKEGLAEAEIGEILQKGYRLHDRLLRPALVKVLLPKKD